MDIKAILAAFALLSSLQSGAQSLYPGQYPEKRVVRDLAEPEAECFDLDRIRLLPGRFRENMQRDSAWMMSLDTDRLLHSFRTTAGVFSGKEGGYMTVKKLGGWESLDCDLRGHITGHYLSAAALMYASTGEEIFKMKGDSLVSGLAEVQKAWGNGYLSAFPEGLIERNIAGKSVWAPWYTIHKILSGLLDQYLYADNKEALEIASGMGEWAYLRPGQDVRASVRLYRRELLYLQYAQAKPAYLLLEPFGHGGGLLRKGIVGLLHQAGTQMEDGGQDNR